jgi:LysR family transcriptional regulator, carnitine catabolism transcriptional activator
MMNFTSRQLQAFSLVAQHRNFSRAAQALFITPSGLSVLIRELESQLGFRLFDRTTRHVVLTAYGHELLPVAQRSLAALDGAVSRIGRFATEGSRSLSVAAAPLIAANVLPQAIKEFRSHRPDLRIQLFDCEPASIIPMVESGTTDIGLRVLFKPTPGLRRTPLFRFSLMVVRADHDPAFRRASTTWSALKEEKLISLVPANEIQQLVNKHLAQAGVSLQPSGVIKYVDTLLAMVEAGEGSGIVPSWALAACRNRKVVTSRLINPVVNLDFYQISDRGKQLPPGANDFTSFLQSYIARWAGRAGIL